MALDPTHIYLRLLTLELVHPLASQTFFTSEVQKGHLNTGTEAPPSSQSTV